MVGGGSRRDEAPTLNSNNVFAALSSLKKKKSIKNKEQGRGGAVSGEETPEKKEVFWAPAPLTATSWADVEDDDDYYATTAPPDSSWAAPVNSEKANESDAAVDAREEPERTLTDAQKHEFENVLRALTNKWNQIEEAMGFVLDNADAAGELVDVLTQSLTLKGIPIGKKIARLELVSYILQESGAPGRNASAYRTKFETTLPDIMESFGDFYHSTMGCFVAEVLKAHILRILQVWANRAVFSDAYVNGLQATFLRSENFGVIPFHSIYGHGFEIEERLSPEDTVMGGKTNKDLASSMGQGAATKELMSLPLAELLSGWCEQNGLSLDADRGMIIAQLLMSHEEAEKLTFYKLDTSISAHAESQMNEEHRQKLRRLEVAKEDIEKKVAVYRKQLESLNGLSDSGERWLRQ